MLLATQAETIKIAKTDFTVELIQVSGEYLSARKLKPFWLARHETTFEAFQEYFQDRQETKVDGITRPSTPYEPPNGKMGVGKHPAVGMRWHDTAASGFAVNP